VVASLIVYWAGWNTLWRLGVAIVLGYLLLGSYAAWATLRRLPRAPELEWKAALWLPVYLAGMGLFSYEGGFGAGAQRHLGLGWDIAAITVFALGIYYWARAAALPAEVIERNVLRAARAESPEGGPGAAAGAGETGTPPAPALNRP
jgi:hypothetical protein